MWPVQLPLLVVALLLLVLLGRVVLMVRHLLLTLPHWLQQQPKHNQTQTATIE
jgi:hypothetical protein